MNSNSHIPYLQAQLALNSMVPVKGIDLFY